MKILSFDDLRGKGIHYTRQHIHRLIRKEKFPRPFKLVEGGNNTWTEAEIDQYLKDRIAAREGALNTTM
jgi:prophage regulatory protein